MERHAKLYEFRKRENSKKLCNIIIKIPLVCAIGNTGNNIYKAFC